MYKKYCSLLASGEGHVKKVLLAPGQRRSMRGQCGKGKCHDESDESPLPAEIMSKSKLMTDNTTLTNLNQFMTCELKIHKKIPYLHISLINQSTNCKNQWQLNPH